LKKRVKDFSRRNADGDVIGELLVGAS
jgi:hypothetical protein